MIVGVNKYVSDDEDATRDPAHRVEVEIEPARAGWRRCGPAATTTAVDGCPRGAAPRPRPGDANLMPLIVDAARARASEGEIVDAMKAVFGGYREPPRV